MAIYHQLPTLLFAIIAFVSGSLLTYLLVLTPQLRSQSSSLLLNLRGLGLSSASNDSYLGYILGDTKINSDETTATYLGHKTGW